MSRLLYLPLIAVPSSLRSAVPMANNTLDMFVNSTWGMVEDVIQFRTASFLAILIGLYLFTCAVGTIILALASWRSRRKATHVEARPLHTGEVLPQTVGIPSTSPAVTAAEVQEPALQEEVPLRSWGSFLSAEGVKAVDPEDVQLQGPALTKARTSYFQQSGDQRAGTQDQLRLLQAAFAGTFTLCMGTVLYCVQAGLLTKDTGLTWEAYTFLFACGCLWQLVQALACARFLPKGRVYPLKTFAVATISGVWPILSDAYDTLKDAQFGGLCVQSSSGFTVAMGVWTWLYLIAFHAYFFVRKKEGCLVELASNHLAVWVAPMEADFPQRSGVSDDTWSTWWRRKWQEDVLPVIYKQVTPTKMFPWASLAALVL